jgi:hypothetical protein
MESNHHGVAPASPSSWCVYQFRHHRMYNPTFVTGTILISPRWLSVNIKVTDPNYFFGAAGAVDGAGACWTGWEAGAGAAEGLP